MAEAQAECSVQPGIIARLLLDSISAVPSARRLRGRGRPASLLWIKSCSLRVQERQCVSKFHSLARVLHWP